MADPQAPDPLLAYPIVVKLPVAWGEMDSFRHVNNTVYFRYFESVRIAYLEQIGLRSADDNGGVGPILASTSCRFRRPLTYPDHVRVGARVPQVDADRFTMEYLIFSEAQQTVAATGDGLIVAFDYLRGHKAPLPEAVREAIARLESRAF